MGWHQRSENTRRTKDDHGPNHFSSYTPVPSDSCPLSPNAKKLNKVVYVIQSCLLGMSYSIIWPSVWPYIESYGSDAFSSKVFYGMAYIAYPFASMLSSFVFKKIAPYGGSFKTLLLLLNCFEIVGSLVYTLPFHPVLPVVGRFMAGFGDVFYLLLAKEIAVMFRQLDTEIITMQCLISFVIGVVLAPGLSLATWKVDFEVIGWRINYLNVAGLNMAVLFLAVQFIIMVTLTSLSPYERACRESDTKNAPPSKPVHNMPANGYSSKHESGPSSFYIVYILLFAFIFGFSVGSFELILPMIYWQSFPGNFIGIAAIYAFIAGTYAIFLVMTVSLSYKCKPRLIVSIGLLTSTMGQLILLYYELALSASVLVVEVGMSLLLAVLWSVDDVLFIDLIAHLVPLKQQEPVHGLRRAVSKFAFAISGILIPLAYSKLVIVTPTFIVANAVLYMLFHVLSYAVSGKFFG